MFALLNPRIWIALAIVAALAFSHFSAYRAGKGVIRAKWTASIASANADARKLEQQRQRRADEASSLAAKRASVLAADARRARLAADSLRGTLDATERMARESLDASTRAVSALRVVFDSCRAEYEALGAEAQGHANDSLMYQRAWPK